MALRVTPEVFFVITGDCVAAAVHGRARSPVGARAQGDVGAPDLVRDVPAHGRGVDWRIFTGPFQPKSLRDPTIRARTVPWL